MRESVVQFDLLREIAPGDADVLLHGIEARAADLPKNAQWGWISPQVLALRTPPVVWWLVFAGRRADVIWEPTPITRPLLTKKRRAEIEALVRQSLLQAGLVE